MNIKTYCLATLFLVELSATVAASEGIDGIATELKADDLAIVQMGEMVNQAQNGIQASPRKNHSLKNY